LQGWMTNLEITNLPTINGGTLAAALSLSSYLLKTDTAAMLTNYINKADTASMLTNYINKADTAAMLSNYQDASDVNATLAAYLPIANGTATGTLTTAALNVGNTSLSIDSIGLVDGKITFYDAADTLGVYIIASNIVDLADYAVMLADSTTGAGHYVSDHRGDDIEAALADTVAFDTEELSDVVQLNAATRSVMTFGAGGGNAGDTTLFTTSSLYGSAYWGGSLSFHVDSMIVSMVHGLGLDTLDVQISWNDTLKAVVPTKLNTAALPIGRAAGVNKSLTVGQVDAVFDNAVIPPGKMVWCTTPYVPAAALKRKPTFLSVTLVGHLQ
jgi:hypothetical protein